MDTAKYSNGRHSKSQINVFSLLIICFTFFVMAGVTGCFESEAEDAPQPAGETPVAGNPQLSPGATLYANNCLGCHGSADASTVDDPSVSGISAALNLSFMSGVSLTADEIQSISDYLTGTTGGGTGSGGTGGGSGGPPASHTNPEDGIMHAPGNTLPFSSGCTVCHGETLAGGVGPSCFMCHGQRWDEGPGSAGGSGTGGTGSDGLALYTTYCAACHGVTGTGLTGRTTDQISTAISNVTGMNSIALSLTELQAIADYLVAPGSTGGGDTGGGTGGGTGGTVDGATLFADNCSICHGDGSNINDPSVTGITTALNLSFMSGISLTADEIQAISNHLSGGSGGSSGGGDTGGGTGGGDTGGSTGGGTGTVDGATLFADNCSGCHQDGSNINDPSVTGITNALNLSFMSGISLTADEIQAISNHLTGGSGGSTGGGDTGGGTGGGTGSLPATHTNSEEGVLHANGNNYPYTNGCTACHGSTLQGAIGPSCYACHGVEWNESAPSGGGDSGGSTGGGTGTVDGATLFANNCSTCHGDGSNISDPSVTGINNALNLNFMSGISLTADEIQAISTHLTGGSGGGTGSGGTSGGTGGGSGTIDGATLFANNCSTCHGDGSNINDPSTSGITNALNLSFMSNISLTTDEIQAISDFLSGGTGGSTGGGTGGGSTGGGTNGPPASHTNPEDGVLHAPGNNYPYSNGCTACHGSTLQGGVGPSCFACHGQEWNESASSGGGDGGSTGSGSTGGGSGTEGQALYTTYCSACHGATGSGINGRTAGAISTALANVGSMGNISITSTEIQAIADYLAGSTGGGNTGGSTGGGSGGVSVSHNNSEEGVMHASGNNTPYSSGCTACHGVTLQGGIGPSCYSCHGQEWSGSSGGSEGGGSE
jgi:mono/diheme cytochrome c family protein